MQDLANDIKAIKQSHNAHLGNLTEISNYIKRFETQMQEADIQVPFQLQLTNWSLETYEHGGTSLEWTLCEKSNKWRIFYRLYEDHGFQEVINDFKPLIEWDIETRIKGAFRLKEFVEAFESKVSEDYLTSAEALAFLNGKIAITFLNETV